MVSPKVLSLNCLVDKELARWPHTESSHQCFYVQMGISDEWCPSEICTGTSTAQCLHL